MASEVKGRLLEFLHYKRISQVDFTRMLGVSSSYVGAMRKSISDEKLLKIRQMFPELNPDWLLYGEGEMLQDGTDTAVDSSKQSPAGAHLVPLLPTEAYAGNLQAYSEGVMRNECEMVVTQIGRAEMAIRVSGDSMTPTIPDGALLFISKISDRGFIPWGHPLVVDTDNGVVVKCLYPVKGEPGVLEARSYNPQYPPFEIPSDSVYGLYRILGVLSLYTTI